MAKLQFVDIDDEIKDIANIDSPSFKGEGTTVNPIDTNNEQIINFRYLKRLLDKAINNYNTETIESSSNCISGLVPGADYIINLYGINTINVDPDFPYEYIWADSYPDSYIFINNTDKVFLEDNDHPLPKGYVKIGYFAILDKGNNVISKSNDIIRYIDWPNNNASFPDSITLRITAPIDGFIYGFMNYGMHFANPIPVKYMSAVRVNEEKIDTYKASIVQQDNQSIIVTVNGIDYKENFTALPGSEFSARAIGYPGYKGGEVEPSSGVFDDNKIFIASPASITTYTAAIVQTEHQTITVTYNGASYTSDITNLPLNAVLVTRITNVEYGYNAGKVLPKANIKMKEDITITATPVVPIIYKVTINQNDNEIIRVTCGDKTYTETFYTDFRNKIIVNVYSLVTDIYRPGIIVMGGNYLNTEVENEFLVNGNVTITASTVRPAKYRVIVRQQPREIVEVTYDGKIYTETFMAKYGSTIEINVYSINEEAYLPGDIVITGEYSPTSSPNKFITNGDISVTATSVTPKS
ncbi:MAG: hypothetical protein IJ880_02010 [Bacilli bacterium]|nr:hypothetical protein [Bacilli bacterium]